MWLKVLSGLEGYISLIQEVLDINSDENDNNDFNIEIISPLSTIVNKYEYILPASLA